MRHVQVVGVIALLATATVTAGGCGSSLRNESTYAARLPAEVRPSYDLFAQRCSKCHSLSRPLDSGIEDDAYWAIYVRRMRLQPGSGISEADERTILEFLRYYARTRREERASGRSAAPVDAGATATPAPAPAPTPAHVDADASTSPGGGA